jgi:hypothetical protein
MLSTTIGSLNHCLIGDDVELLLVLALHVDGALDAGEVGDGRALHQRRDLLARRGDAGQHDGHLAVDVPGLLLLQQPRRQRRDLVAALLLARLRGRGHRVHGSHAAHVGSWRQARRRDDPAGPPRLAEEREAASEGGRLAGEQEKMGRGRCGGHCCWLALHLPRLPCLADPRVGGGGFLFCSFFFGLSGCGLCGFGAGVWIGERIVRMALLWLLLQLECTRGHLNNSHSHAVA